jgi:hypothetical protein
MTRLWMLLGLCAALALGQIYRSTRLTARVEVSLEGAPGARLYLFKSGKPFRLHPVDAVIPLNVDLFYRDTLWKRMARPSTLEAIAQGQSHFYLLTGKANFELPPGEYRIEAYRGLFHTPAAAGFALAPGEDRKVQLALPRWDAATAGWLSGDDHIHLPRSAAENETFLDWLTAEDLSVGNFLQLQRQIDAAPQYAFGDAGEARRAGYSIRSGQESRAEYYGHINMLGGRELIRPLSVGAMYANEPAAWPYPDVLFARGRKAGALTGFAPFHGSMPHSTMLMDLALGNLDFLEVFQFGKLWASEWYELLNAGFKVTGIAGSDFPVPLSRFHPWPARLPLLGPERTLVKAAPGAAAWTAWAEGVKNGDAVVSNGPLVTIRLEGETAIAEASYYEPLQTLEIIRNGVVIGQAKGDGKTTRLRWRVQAVDGDSAWFAARAEGPTLEGGLVIQAHTNPVFLLRGGMPVRAGGARERLARKWAEELAYYRGANLPFANAEQRDAFFVAGEKALAILTESARPPAFQQVARR